MENRTNMIETNKGMEQIKLHTVVPRFPGLRILKHTRSPDIQNPDIESPVTNCPDIEACQDFSLSGQKHQDFEAV